MNKTILCYGDSNTYGYNPLNGLRYAKGIRWTGCLQEMLGEEYSIIEEGCNGRTTVFDDPLEGWKNGLDYLRPCLNSHKPIDIVILMLGSNDLKTTFGATAKEIADGVEILVDVIKTFSMEKQGFEPVIILLSPPEIGDGILSFIMHLRTVLYCVQKNCRRNIVRWQKEKDVYSVNHQTTSNHHRQIHFILCRRSIRNWRRY